MATITYEPECAVEEDDLGLTLLQISRKHGVPHISACGGRARCSTCRVLISDGRDHVPPRNEAECRLATLKGLEDDVRLACQTRVTGSVHLRRLVLDEGDVELAGADTGAGMAREMPLAVLFSDLRNFTPFAESHLPYDAVHILNRYFLLAGAAIFRHQGTLDKYIGDGIMALFGLGGEDPSVACGRAVRAALETIDGMPALNRYLQGQFGDTLDVGIGVHFGTALVGDVGHPARRQFTAMGDVVNVASRIESATKEVGARLLISEAVRAQLEGKLVLGRRAETSLKGKSVPVLLHEVLGVTAE